MFESFNVPGLYIAVQVKTKLFLQFPTELSCPLVDGTVIPEAVCGKTERCVLAFPAPLVHTPPHSGLNSNIVENMFCVWFYVYTIDTGFIWLFVRALKSVVFLFG